MSVVGVSGSPLLNGNTDRIIKALLRQSGKDHIFVNLSTLRYDPCRACCHLCAKTQLCPLDDDLKPYLEPIRDAEALIFGTPIHARHMTGWMFSFLTRLSCFYHFKHLLKGKPVVLVVADLLRESGERFIPGFVQSISHMAKAKTIGYINYTSSMPPCYKCGMGKVCKVGGLWHMLGCSEEKLKNFELTKDMVKRWEDCRETVAEVGRYAKILSEL